MRRWVRRERFEDRSRVEVKADRHDGNNKEEELDCIGDCAELISPGKDHFTCSEW